MLMHNIFVKIDGLTIKEDLSHDYICKKKKKKPQIRRVSKSNSSKAPTY